MTAHCNCEEFTSSGVRKYCHDWIPASMTYIIRGIGLDLTGQVSAWNLETNSQADFAQRVGCLMSVVQWTLRVSTRAFVFINACLKDFVVLTVASRGI